MTDHSGNQEKVSEPMQPQLCVKCYEFFGNAANLNMCSKCFRATQAPKDAPAPEAPTPEAVKPLRSSLSGVGSGVASSSLPESPLVPKPLAADSPMSSSALQSPAAKAETGMVCPPAVEPKSEQAKVEAVAAATAAATSSGRPPQKHKNRCYSCKKKIGLTGFKCKCGYLFCSEHRYSDKHDCPFDYKLAGREVIAKANPKVVASKINKI